MAGTLQALIGFFVWKLRGRNEHFEQIEAKSKEDEEQIRGIQRDNEARFRVLFAEADLSESGSWETGDTE